MPPTAAGENVVCMVKRTLPAVDTLPEREVTCGHLMTYVRADPSKSVSSGGTNTLWNWQFRAVGGLDKSGNVVVPARWPHVGLVARLYLGVDATSCQAERNFSALKLIVSDLRAKSSPGKVEKTIFLRLNKHLIPGLGKVLGDLDVLKDERKSSREAA